MSLTDRHDPRRFRHLAKIAPNGTVLAVVEIADGAPDPAIDGNRYVEVTDLYPYDFTGVNVVGAPAVLTDPVPVEDGKKPLPTAVAALTPADLKAALIQRNTVRRG